MFDKSKLAAILEDEGLIKTARYEFPFQNFARKDQTRIESLISKSMKGLNIYDRSPGGGKEMFERKIVAAAERMAKSIKDWKKAARRGAAARVSLALVGSGQVIIDEVAKVFFERADELYDNRTAKIAGGTDFWEWGAGSDPRKIFNDLQSDAKHEYGHGGYTGSIAEKDGYKVRSREKMSKKEAEAFADKDIDNNDKWGPAFAIPSGNGWLFYGIASE